MVEELDVRVQVLVEVAARLQRPGDRTDRVHGRAQAPKTTSAPSGLDARLLEPPRRRANAVSFLVAMSVRRRLASLSGWCAGSAMHRDWSAGWPPRRRRAGLRSSSAVVAVGVWWLQAVAHASCRRSRLRHVPRRVRRALPIRPDRPRIRAGADAGCAARRRRAARSLRRRARRAASCRSSTRRRSRRGSSPRAASAGAAALLTVVVLLLYPSYGILIHELSSDSVFAVAFAGLVAARRPRAPGRRRREASRSSARVSRSSCSCGRAIRCCSCSR